MKLWLALLGVSLAFLTVGVNTQQQVEASDTTKQLNSCDLKAGQSGLLRGIVSEVNRMPGSNQVISTLTAAGGCEVSVMGPPQDLRELTTVGTQARFVATVQQAGTVSNVRGVTLDTLAGYGQPGAVNNNNNVPSAVPVISSIRVWVNTSPEWFSPNEGALSIKGRVYVISSDLEKQISYNNFNSFWFSSDGKKIVAVNPG